MHKLDVAAILAQVSGLSILAADTTFQASLVSLFGMNGPKIVAAIGLVAVLASTILRIIGSPSTSQGAKS